MRKEIKGLYLVQYFPPEKSSGSDLVEDLLEGFANEEWNIDLFTPTPTRGVTKAQRMEYCQRKRVEKILKGNVIIHRMHLYREGKSFIGRAIRYILFSIECLWKSVTVPADFIFTGSGPPSQGVVVALAKKISEKKVVYNLQDIFPDSLVTSGICDENSVLMKIGYAMEKFTYKNVDLIITVSDDMEENIRRKGVPSEKIKVVRNWIDTDKVFPIEREKNLVFDKLGITREKFLVVYAGNIGKVQGIDVIVRAAEKLKENVDIQFIIIGNGSEEEEIKNMILKKELNNIAMFPLLESEWVSQVYSMADVCIISCKPGTGGSGMPSKTWTIMAAGTPIIASFDKGSEMEKIITEAKCGICTEAGNENTLVEAIEKMFFNKKDMKTMSYNAREYAVQHVSKEKAVQMYINCINDLLEKGR